MCIRDRPISPPRVDSSKGPTPGKSAKFCIFLDFFGPWKKWPRMAPNGAGRFFFLLIQTLPTFWAEWISILRIFNSWIFWIPNSQISKISRFPENRSLFVGRPFFRKLFASKNDAERYRQNILEPNFQKHTLFQFEGHRFLQAPNFLTSDYVSQGRFSSRKVAPGFLEAPKFWRCPRLFPPRKKCPTKQMDAQPSGRRKT